MFTVLAEMKTTAGLNLIKLVKSNEDRIKEIVKENRIKEPYFGSIERHGKEYFAIAFVEKGNVAIHYFEVKNGKIGQQIGAMSFYKGKKLGI